MLIEKNDNPERCHREPEMLEKDNNLERCHRGPEMLEKDDNPERCHKEPEMLKKNGNPERCHNRSNESEMLCKYRCHDAPKVRGKLGMLEGSSGSGRDHKRPEVLREWNDSEEHQGGPEMGGENDPNRTQENGTELKKTKISKRANDNLEMAKRAKNPKQYRNKPERLESTGQEKSGATKGDIMEMLME